MIYIKPNTSIKEISESCQMFFEDLTPEPEQLHIFCGDFNIDHITKNINLTKMKDILSSYNLNNISNIGCTRETAKSRTKIDVVSANMKSADHNTV